ncbi:MAG: hypothetical protein ACJ0F8_02980 [Gammaproteobacteria bacterium]|uniref:Uncharacterized protein n=1 Tax=SAR86 cluster bacterium TaxID=2030880 RepID=A0A520N0D1_9GAMM|nr:MAG: hypothetical protein EVA92_02045 [SAR86 cluster bacterium]|tara:strand:+ start:413 stop:826 length:414 start_codon:yes stop_codon:yes gene_type:complete
MISKLSKREKILVLILAITLAVVLLIYIQNLILNSISTSRINLNNELKKYEITKQNLAIIESRKDLASTAMSGNQIFTYLTNIGYSVLQDQGILYVNNLSNVSLQEIVLILDAQQNNIDQIKIIPKENYFQLEITIE